MQDKIAFLKELIAFRSVSADIPAVNRLQERLKEVMEADGLFCVMEEIDGRKVLYASTTGNKTTDLLFNAHIDIVPATNEAQYEVQEKEGILYGRGVCDCLANAIVIMETLKNLRGRCDAGAIFTADEEVGGHTTEVMVERGYGAGKLVIVNDGNNGCGKLTYAQKGICILRLTARGRSGHASCPFAFDNPIDKLLKGYLKLLESWSNPVRYDDWRTSMAACTISGGSAVNQIPEEASMVINFRPVSIEDFNAIPGIVAEITGLEVEFLRGCLPYEGDPQAPAIRTMAQTIRDICGHDCQLVRMTGATDARHLQKIGVPVVIIGCEGGGAHSENEWLKVGAMEQLIAVQTETSLRLAGK